MTIAGRLLSLVVAGLVVAACGSAATPSLAPTASPAPSAGASSPGTDPNAPVGIDLPPGGGGDPGVVDPNAGRIVVPKPGQLDVHPIAAQALSARVDGRRVGVSIAYASGVEPCNVLDSIVVRTGPGSFEITLREGHGPGEGVCIDLAEFKRALVDLGELEPGTYTITDGTGVAKPISVTVA
ncbi:MAG: hypothetical protein ACJ77Y_04065 [Chloroflexota bacterium]